ncbi:MAG: hypothetical protein M1832_001576 [Thelocarpon impressellum]|nr:MAG: hypothetical protein M1832_001576 [Thelocarpon impressellum]
MGSKRLKPSPIGSLPFKPANKFKRQELHVKHKKAKDSSKRDERFRRKREEDQDPELRRERLKRNVPATLDRKRVWDEADDDMGHGIGLSVDVERLKRRRVDKSPESQPEGNGPEDSDEDSMLESGSDEEDSPPKVSLKTRRSPSPVESTTSTKLDMTPEALAAKFPTLFSADPPPIPKVLVTTSINSTLHHEANVLTALFPHSVYIPRSAHRYGHKFSVREICSFASNRKYTTLVLLKEDQKKATGISIVHLPLGPTFHFSVSNWVEGKKLPGHGNPTGHSPELILNNFRTPLGLLTAHLFRSLFPPQPDLRGRQVVTLHNQRDYIFLRRHRYIFRDKRPTEKSVVGPDGKEVRGAEEIRAGLQELGPRFTMKLRRIDKGIGRAGSAGQVEWEWKGGMDKQRTKFQL